VFFFFGPRSGVVLFIYAPRSGSNGNARWEVEVCGVLTDIDNNLVAEICTAGLLYVLEFVVFLYT